MLNPATQKVPDDVNQTNKKQDTLYPWRQPKEVTSTSHANFISINVDSITKMQIHQVPILVTPEADSKEKEVPFSWQVIPEIPQVYQHLFNFNEV